MPTLSDVAARIQADFATLLDLVGNTPSAQLVVDNITELKTIEQACNTKAAFDSLIAYSVEQAFNQQLITSDTPTDFLMDTLDLSYHEANNRLQRGHTDHAPLPDGEQAALADAQRRAARDNAIAARLSASKLNIVNSALQDLREGTTPTKQHIYAEAVEQAQHRSERDLKTWVNKAVRRANKTVDADPTEAMGKRKLRINTQDAFGNHPFTGVMTAAQQAIIMAAITPLAKRGCLVSASPTNDTRTLGQRHMDALTHICQEHLKNKKQPAGNHGIASLVISITADELAHLRAEHELPTNTGTLLTPVEAAALLGSPYDFLAIHDLENPANLTLQRGSRNASAWHKLALFVQELVCSHPDCDAPTIMCDQHHIDAWSFNGATDLVNLTLQCRHHHRFNDDTKTNHQRGHATRQTTGDKRVGYINPNNPHVVELNNTTAHDECAAEKLRKRRP